MKKIIIAAFYLLISSIYAISLDSQLIREAQKNYADKFTDYPILIFDIDEVEALYLKAGAFGEGKHKQQLRVEVIKDYVAQKTGVELSTNHAINFEVYTTTLKGSAVALPLIKGYYRSSGTLICGVFPGSPNGNGRTETERLQGMGQKNAVHNFTYRNLKNVLKYKELRLFTLYHEIAHCMDRKFLPDALSSYQPSAHDTHLAESFAESAALLILEKEGYSNLGYTRALYRNFYSKVMGPWFVENSHLGFGDESFAKAGSIYWLTPSLLEAQKRIDHLGSDFIRSRDISDLLSLAKEIVEDVALSSRAFHAVHRYQELGQEAIDEYKSYSERMPELMLGAYQGLLDYIEVTESLHRETLRDFSYDPVISVGIMPRLLDMEELCSLEMGTQEFWAVVDDYRSYLASYPLFQDISWQREFKESLDNLMAQLQNCHLKN